MWIFLKFLLFGILTMLSGEFQNLAILGGAPQFFLAAVLLYAFLTMILYFIGKGIDRMFAKKADVVYYLVAGTIGLVIIEWIILGNQPGSGRGAIQTGMFAWWAAVFTVPRIFTAEQDAAIKSVRRRSLIALAIYSVLSLIITVIVRDPAITGLMFAVGYIILNFQFIPYLSRNFSLAAVRVFMWFLVIGAVVNILVAW